MIVGSQRALFDIPSDVAYFNCAYNGPLLNASVEAMTKGSQSKARPWERRPSDFFDDPEAFRLAAAKAFGSSGDNFAVIPSASYGVSCVARIFEDRLSEGDNILVLDEAFPSNYLPWERLSSQTGADLCVVESPPDFNWTKAVLERISSKTKVVAIPNCHWTNGAILRLAEISEAARAAGAFLVLEVTQSLGAMPLDLEAVRPDFVIAAGYKWLLCPYGLSLLYADPKWHQARPLEETWLSRADAHVFENLVEYNDNYQLGARRFDMGQKSIPSVLPGGVCALEQIGRWGVANISEALGKITEQIASIVEPFGFEPVPQNARVPHILGASMSAGIPDQLLPRLAEEKVFLSRRGNSLRFAPHLHIGDQDLDHLADALQRVLK